MSDFDNFNLLIENALIQEETYNNQVKNFKEYLQQYNLEDKIYNLETIDIDNYFDYSIPKKIGNTSTLTSHIAALKFIFNKMIENDIQSFKKLYGHLDNELYKINLSLKVPSPSRSTVINDELLISVILKFEEHIDIFFSNDSNKVIKDMAPVLMSYLYIKISLLLPLKPHEILTKKFIGIKLNSSRIIEHNDFKINIPNNFKKDIVKIINYFEEKFNKQYDDNEPLFHFLNGSSPDTNKLSGWLTKSYKELKLNNMLAKSSSKSIKVKNLYPPETFKTKSIITLINNGVDILYLKKLTGLDTKTLLKNKDLFDQGRLNNTPSQFINNSFVNTPFYLYL